MHLVIVILEIYYCMTLFQCMPLQVARRIFCKVHSNIPSSLFIAVSGLETLYPRFPRGNKGTDEMIVLLAS